MTHTISSRQERLSPQTQISLDLISAQQQSHKAKKHPSREVAKSSVQPLVSGLQIVHATSDRVRIRATDGSHNSRIESIAQTLRQQEGVTNVSFNQETGSLVIAFDKNKLSLPQIWEILQSLGIQELQAAPKSRSNQDPFAAWKSLDFWKEQGISFIPLISGLAVTGRLGIHGLAAIPVYMITADTTRHVIDYLRPQFSASDHRKSKEQEDRETRKQEDKKTDRENSSSFSPSSVIAYSVVHAIPGRIRFNVPRLAKDRAYTRRLERLLKGDSQVKNVRVKPDAQSIAIAYKPGEIPLSHWVNLMELADKEITPISPVLTTITQQPPLEAQPVTQPSEPIDSTTTVSEIPIQEASLWADFKLPYLCFFLDFMANLPVDSLE